MRAFVTGGSGFVGSHVVEALLTRGYAVTCLVRDVQRPGWLAGKPVHLVPGVLDDPTQIRTALAADPIDVVIHVAGRTKAFDPATLERDNRLATHHLLEAIADVTPTVRRVVTVSSLAAAGPALADRPRREDDPCQPISPYGQSKLGAEAVVRAYADRLPICIVRPPVVYGPRDRDGLALFRAVRLGIRPVVGAGRRVSLIHAADLAEGIVLAAEAPSAVGRTYFLTAEPPCSWEAFTAAIARALGRPAFRLPIPDAAVALAGFVSEIAARLRGEPTVFDRAKAREALAHSWVCDGTRAAVELGFRAKRDLERGIAETAAWYRAHGWL